MLDDIYEYIKEHPLELIIVALAMIAILFSMRSTNKLIITLQEGVIL